MKKREDANMKSPDVIDKVRDQYEELPYPYRDPEDEQNRLLRTYGASIEEINHYCFKGKETFDNVRILIAGGGTGDAVMHLGEQLRNKPGAELVYLDMSEASLDIAKARARVRGLENIQWHLGSLLDLPGMGLGQFDFINCVGVIHHLPAPEEGLHALAGVLKPTGAMYLMVYATYGRHAVYHAQNLFRDILPRDISIAEKIKLARRWIDAFPACSYMKQSLPRWQTEISTDAGLLDLLLHSQDRSYTVDEVYELTEACGFNIVTFMGIFKPAYNIKNIVKDQELLATLGKLSRREQQALAERLHCNIPKHSIYISAVENPEAGFEDGENTIVLSQMLVGRAMELHHAIVPGQTMQLNLGALGSMEIPATEITRSVFKYLDKELSNNMVISKVVEDVPGVKESDVRKELETVYTRFNEYSCMFLKSTAVARYPEINYSKISGPR